MGKFESIAAKIAMLPVERQDEIAVILEGAFAGDFDQASVLNVEQAAEIEQFLQGPAALASEADVEAFFADALAG